MSLADQRAAKRNRIYTAEDVATHTSASDCWVTYQGKVYDVTAFLEDHPGSDELILQFAGKDVEEAMEDPMEHSHSDSAYQVLNEYQVGRIVSGESITDPGFEYQDGWAPTDTDEKSDWEKNQFLDLDRPLIMQVWNSQFSKSFYLQQVHQPRHLPRPARLFGPSYLEVFTMTAWYVVPIIWVPITLYILRQSILQQLANGVDMTKTLQRTGICFVAGNIIWTILEYVMHRFVFHVEEWLPDRPFCLMLHFLLHGIHHYVPMDRMRLVMPPILFTALQAPFTKLAHTLFPNWMANGIIAGSFAMYVAYDMLHYAFHHSKIPTYIKAQKSWHMEHHYKEPNLGYGVTSRFWDRMFGTENAPTAASTGAAPVKETKANQ
ncbi:fatty acid alpha-hydroxylase [Sporobolomyces koalae]|uniref:fatty acid alpha-hydroxylase n=1 Tax=Sporobolomyces koalae TaxID=500713 RepID=UPI003173B8D0